MKEIDGVLWVNDNIQCDTHIVLWILNSYPVSCVHRAASTEEALYMATTKKYSLIVSNLRRPEDWNAGITLLEKLREAGVQTKYIVYTGRVIPEKEHKVLKLGGYAYTASEEVLKAFVHTALMTELVKEENVIRPRNAKKEREGLLWVNDDTYADLAVRSWISRNCELKAIHIAASTEEALQLAGQNKYSLIISNMRRPGDEEAGITLLEKLRKAGIDTTYIVYTGHVDAKKERKFYELGGYSYIVNEPTLKYNIKAALNAEMAKA